MHHSSRLTQKIRYLRGRTTVHSLNIFSVKRILRFFNQIYIHNIKTKKSDIHHKNPRSS